MRHRPSWPLAGLLIALLLAGCVGREPVMLDLDRPAPYQAVVVADDGYRLPLRHWRPAGPPRAVVLGVHGFNDHAGSLAMLAEPLRRSGIAVYAHDQRGFGSTRQRGRWPGHEALVDDVAHLAGWLRERHPQVPLYLVGESMGAAVSILALTRSSPAPVDGSVLISPAVWGRSTMPWYQRLGLWLGVRLAPWASASARLREGLGIEPTDDPEIKRRLARDSLLLRRARLDALDGVTSLMDDALAASPGLPGPTLILYGDRDEVIPSTALCALLERLSAGSPSAPRLALYPGGYHMLTRYSRGQRTHADVTAWLLDPATPLPSRHEVSHAEAREQLCSA